MCLHEAGYDKRWKTEMKIARSTVLLHSAKTQTKLLGRRLPNHNVFWKQKIINFFCKQTNNIQIFNYKTVENFKPIWTYLTSQETALIFMNVIGRYAKKIGNLLFSYNVVIGQSSSESPGLSVRAVNTC